MWTFSFAEVALVMVAVAFDLSAETEAVAFVSTVELVLFVLVLLAAAGNFSVGFVVAVVFAIAGVVAFAVVLAVSIVADSVVFAAVVLVVLAVTL